MAVQDSRKLGGLQGAAAGDSFALKGSGCSTPTSHDLSFALFMRGYADASQLGLSAFTATMINSVR